MCDHTSPLTSQIPKQFQAPNISENSGRKTAGRLGHKSINWLSFTMHVSDWSSRGWDIWQWPIQPQPSRIYTWFQCTM